MTMSSSQRVLAAIGSVAGACAIAVPAAIALSHNPSFGQRIPVHAPSSAHIVSFDDHGGVLEIAHPRRHHHRTEPSSSRRHDDPSSTAMPTSHEPEPGDDHGGNDDHGGDHHGGSDDGR